MRVDLSLRLRRRWLCDHHGHLGDDGYQALRRRAPPAGRAAARCAHHPNRTVSQTQQTDLHPEPAVKAAAILDDGRVDIDALLATVARDCQRQGRHVRGLLMNRVGAGGCAGDMVLTDIASGERYLVSQPLGKGSTACRADPQGFARASRVLRDALEQSPDLVICNRFGGLEAEGGGFAAELLALMAHGVPLLTAVAQRNREKWQRFSGGAPLLPAHAAAVAAWIGQALGVAARERT
jgi:nucleoside-triphosphatase THEP1